MHVQMKELWKGHLLFKQGKIELVPTKWVWHYWGKDVTPVDLDALWKGLLLEGMYEPLIMRVGLKNNKFRLESGNHRIQLFHKYGVPMIPVTVQIHDVCGPEEMDQLTDATYYFDAPEGFLITERTDEYMKPSEVFKSLSK
ncbi:MAG: hypothetical protein HY225_01220 [Candidatus Vogelbacteria bacterium]|nr:hypothetical protein [Candidatus Vogelbacteria bacterium]